MYINFKSDLILLQSMLNDLRQSSLKPFRNEYVTTAILGII